jgi:hypothetical protein
MPSYRKKPVVIQAERFDGERESATRIANMAAPNRIEVLTSYPLKLRIPTLEGDMTALPGDYVIRGVKGEVYPCKPDIFEQTYELAE